MYIITSIENNCLKLKKLMEVGMACSTKKQTNKSSI